MARKEQDAGMSKQEEALKRYNNDNLRRYEERHHAAQRETNERFAQLQDSMSKLLERDHGRSSRSSSRTSHRSTARSHVPSENDQGHRHRQEDHRQEIPHQQANLDPQQHQDQHRQEAPHPQANLDPQHHQDRHRQEISIQNANVDPPHRHEDNRHHRHDLPPHRARRVPLADNHVDIEDDEDYVPRHHPRHRHRDRHRHHDDDDEDEEPKHHFNPTKHVIPKYHGTNDPEDYIAWESKVSKLFRVYKVPQDKRVDLASLELEGYAQLWWEQLQVSFEDPIDTW